MNKLLPLISLIGIFVSCEGIIEDNGTVVSSETGKPIEQVQIIWKNIDTTYTDSQGYFEIGEFVGCVPRCPELEIILIKDGYGTKYVNLTGRPDSSRLLIELDPLNGRTSNQIQTSISETLFIVAILISLVNVITLISLWRSVVPNKWIWTIFICFGTISISYNYLNALTDYELFRFFIQLRELHTWYPGWFIIFIPIGTLTFWIYRHQQNQTQ